MNPVSADDRPQDPARTDSYRRLPIEPAAHPLDRLNVIYRRRYLAASVFLLVVLGAFLRSYLTQPLYRAYARLMIETEGDPATTMQVSGAGVSYWRDPQIFYETQYQILTGSDLAQRVVRRLQLDRVPEFTEPGPAPTALEMMLSAATRGVRSLISPPAPETGAVVSSESAAVARLLARVSVQPVAKSRLVDVSVVSSDPALAARAANALADEYVQLNMELRRQNLITTLDWLSRETANQQQKVETSERAMAQYREDNNALSLKERQNIVVARLNQLNDAVTQAKTNRVQKEALNARIADGSVRADTIPAILQNASLQKIKDRLADLRSQRAILVARYGEKHPDIVKLNATIEDASAQLESETAKAIEAVHSDYESAVSEERALYAELERQKDAAMDLDRKSVSYTVLERNAESDRKVFETLLLREKELQVLANSRGNNVRLTDRAATPGAPFTPTPRRDLLLAMVAGLVLALGTVFLLDFLDDTIKHPDDVTGKLQIPLLGLVPAVKANGELVLSNPVPPEFGEAFRSLRTSVALRNRTEAPRLVMVTSAQPFEGKTTTACNLALALAISGARVLLVDADMRRPDVHRRLSVENGKGLSSVLTGQAALDEAVVPVQSPRISVLPSGPTPPNPSELLGSRRMTMLLEQIRNGGYDWVIIDTPPVLVVTDAVVLSSLVGGVAFVIGSEMTRRQHAADAIETLMQSSSCEVGAVLSRVDLKRNKYYRRYYAVKDWNSYCSPPAA